MARPQRLTELKELFERRGIRIRRRLGQNFLVDVNMVHFVAQKARIEEDETVLEVGPGTGTLTGLLAERARRVVAIELDEAMADLAEEHVDALDNVTLVRGDALDGKTSLSPRLLEPLREALADTVGVRLVANLPYAVAVPVIMNVLESDLPVTGLCVTIQRELAERFTADPGTRDYGPVTVLASLLCRSTVLRILPPRVFWPSPKVESAVLRAAPTDDRRERLDSPLWPWFKRVVGAGFRHRRKSLRNGLRGELADVLNQDSLDAVLADFAGDGARTLRIEAMTPLAMWDLAERLNAAREDAA